MLIKLREKFQTIDEMFKECILPFFLLQYVSFLNQFPCYNYYFWKLCSGMFVNLFREFMGDCMNGKV